MSCVCIHVCLSRYLENLHQSNVNCKLYITMFPAYLKNSHQSIYMTWLQDRLGSGWGSRTPDWLYKSQLYDSTVSFATVESYQPTFPLSTRKTVLSTRIYESTSRFVLPTFLTPHLTPHLRWFVKPSSLSIRTNRPSCLTNLTTRHQYWTTIYSDL